MQDLMRNLLLGGGGGFSPQSLFTGGVEGALYDPSDLSTLYQDSAGTTPVTGVEQVVGLMLDKSKNLALGSDFAATAGTWSVQNGTGLSGSNNAITASSASDGARISIAPSTGKWYLLETTVTITSGAMRLMDGSGETLVTYTASGSYTRYEYLSADLRVLNVGANGTWTANISVRELPGNHATSTGSARPTLSARVNLLEYSEQFNNAYWTISNLTVTATNAIAPNGTATAYNVASSGVSSANISRDNISTVVIGSSITLSVFAKAGTANIFRIGHVSSLTAGVWFDLSTGQKLTEKSGVSGTITPVGDGWYKCTSTLIATSNTSFTYFFGPSDADNSTAPPSAGQNMFFWGADLRPTNIGVNIPSYQRIAAATDYDTNGFPFYLSFGGAQSMSTPANLDLTSTDKVTVYAGVRKLVNTPDGIIAELSASVSANNGAFGLYAPSASGAATLRFASKGTIIATTDGPAGFTAPATAVVNAFGDISGDLANLRFNGSQSSSSTTDQGTGNYGTYPLFIGARNNASSFFTGYLYSLIIQGTTASATQLASTEAWVNQKTKAY